MAWFEVKIKTNTEASEILVELMNSIGADGCSVEDPNDPVFFDSDEKNWDYLDVSELKFEYEGALVRAYFDMENDGESSSPYLEEVIGDTLGKVREAGIDIEPATFEVSRIYEDDWANEWKKYFKPIKVGERIWVKPTWETIESSELGINHVVIELDPGGAFGSGTHETTSMCMELIEKHMRAEDTVFDIGCGSGILGVTAAKLGAGRVVAGDIDAAAVVTSAENAQLNGVADKMVAKEGDLFAVAKGEGDGKAELIVANIIADVIIMVAPDVPEFLKKDGVFIASGIIDFRKDEVISSLEAIGFEMIDIMEKGCWVALGCKYNK